MHLTIELDSGKPLDLPIHYNAILQGAIYSSINPTIATMLHDQGFPYKNRTFKLFTYSRLIGKYILEKNNGRIIFPGGASLVISSPVDKVCRAMADLILRNGLRLGSQEVGIKSVGTEVYTVESDSVDLELLSPVVLYSTFLKHEGSKYTCYFQPGEREFERQLGGNLQKKYIACYNKMPPDDEVKVRLLNRPKQNLVTYKNTIIKGYTCRLNLSGPWELLQIAVDAGIGAKNSQGFGCCRPI